MRPINEIIVHCTATSPTWWAKKSLKAQINEVRRWHVEDRAFADIGYHYLIGRNGDMSEGRPVVNVGAHVKGHNTGTIGISLFGGAGASADDKFEDHFTDEQSGALQALILHLQKEYGPNLKLAGHNEYAAKGCPGFAVRPWWASVQSDAPAPAKTPKAAPAPASGGLGAIIAAIIAAILKLLGAKK